MSVRRTHALVAVAIALMNDPSGRHWGYDLGKRSGVRSGVLYPILSRMLEEGWLEDGWEDRNEVVEKRPPRRYYRLTDAGMRELGGLLSQCAADMRFASLLGVVGGRA